MSERSMRSRLTYSGATGRTYAESLHWGIRWEGLRSKWFSRYGRWAEAEECLARLDYLEAGIRRGGKAGLLVATNNLSQR